MNRQFELCSALAAISVSISIACLTGCHDSASRTSHEQTKILSQAADVFAGYATGTVVQARTSLEERIRLFEDGTSLQASGRASLISQDFARLYILERKAGDEAAAQVALIKLRYWYMRKLELDGYKPPEAVQALNEFVPTQVESTVRRLDATPTDGRGPAYLKSN
jgi:hypothetical protein